MEFISTHVGTLLAVASAVVGVLGWFLRLEYRVKTMETKCDIFDLHVTDTGRHANGKAVEKLEHKIDEMQKSMEAKLDELQRNTRDDLRDLFNKVYDQK